MTTLFESQSALLWLTDLSVTGSHTTSVEFRGTRDNTVDTPGVLSGRVQCDKRLRHSIVPSLSRRRRLQW
jgi:hypothetical protein